MKIPFVDLYSLHADMEEELCAVFRRVVSRSTFVLGPEVEQFEADFARYVGTQYCVAVNTGTAAIHLVLAALGVGPGDEVITVAHTFIATAEAITAVGATPKFIDIDPVSFTLDPDLLEAAITSKTKAIIPVHIYGQCADMDRILEIARRHDIPVIEDACQAHGSMYRNQRAGSMGTAGCFSFYPGKNLGACGEGGAITTNDPELAEKMRMWRNHGSSIKYVHDFAGLNMRMEGLQGGILSLKLKRLDDWNDQRRTVAALYDEALAGTDVIAPTEMAYGRHVYHLYVVQSDQRDALQTRLNKAGIETGLHYPIPLHLQKAYRWLGYREGDLPQTERAKDRILSLPVYPGLSAKAAAHVAAEVLESCYVS